MGLLPSEQYRLMIYFAHSTMTMYQKTIVCEKGMTIGDFRRMNAEVVQRVFDEALSMFNYELSFEQMSRAIEVYFICKFNPSSVYETTVFQTSNQ